MLRGVIAVVGAGAAGVVLMNTLETPRNLAVFLQTMGAIVREDPGVLAFTICKPAGGGSGAVDVLLRSP